LDKPLYIQYARFAKGLVPWPGWFLTEDVYYSYGNFVAVKEEIWRRLPVTITLAVGAAVIWLALGIPIGIVSGVKRGSFWDRAGMVIRPHRGVDARLLVGPAAAVHLLVQIQ
jgi:peptide/nickel transport system permease protein